MRTLGFMTHGTIFVETGKRIVNAASWQALGWGVMLQWRSFEDDAVYVCFSVCKEHQEKLSWVLWNWKRGVA